MELNVEQKEKIKQAFIMALAKKYVRDQGMDIKKAEEFLNRVKNGAA